MMPVVGDFEESLNLRLLLLLGRAQLLDCLYKPPESFPIDRRSTVVAAGVAPHSLKLPAPGQACLLLQRSQMVHT